TTYLATNKDMINIDPETVEAFIHAATQWYEYTIENPDEAASILLYQEPDLDPDLVKKIQEWISPKYQDDAEQWGIQEKERWESFVEFMVENNIIDESIDAKKAFTNEFLPEK